MDQVPTIDPADHGRVIHADGTELLRFERSLAATPAAVWEALTTADATEAWAFRATFEPRVGGAVSFDYGEAGGATGEVIAWDEPRVLEYAWDGYGGRWHVCVMVDDAPGGAALTFDHLAPDPHDPDFAAGWHWHLDRLAQHLAGVTPPAVASDAHFEELQRFYAQAGG